MRKHKVILVTAAFLLIGAGTAAAAVGPGQPAAQNMETTVQSAETVAESPDCLAQLYEFKFKVAGEELQIPVSYRELVSRGWEMTHREGEEAYSDKQTVDNFELVYPCFVKGNVVMYARMINGENTARRLMDLEVTELSFSLSAMEGAVPDIVMPGNIVLGKSTESDVKAAYGEPTHSYVGDGARYAVLTYMLSEDQTISFYHDNGADQTINIISLSNEKELYRKGMEYVNSIQPSAEALAYVAPAALGTDITSGIYEFEGDVYQFPAPLTAYLDKGWKIEPRVLFAYYIAPGEEMGVEIERNGVTQHVTVSNNGTERAPIHNCFTTHTPSDSILPSGIKMGSTRSEVLKVLEGVEYTHDKENDLYTVKTADQKNKVEIWLYDYDEKVISFMICPSKD